MKRIGAGPWLGAFVMLISIVNGAEIKVGVFQPEKARARADFQVLQSTPGIQTSDLPELTVEALAGIDVLLIPERAGRRNTGQVKELVKKWVRQGGGLIILRDAVGYRRHPAFFPEIAAGLGNPFDRETGYGNECVVVSEHPITLGLEPKDIVKHSGYDQIVMAVGGDAMVIARDAVLLEDGSIITGEPVLVAGEPGKGRYVACGFVIDADSTVDPASVSQGSQLKLLLNSIRWLAAGEEYTGGIDIGKGVKIERPEDNEP